MPKTSKSKSKFTESKKRIRQTTEKQQAVAAELQKALAQLDDGPLE